MYSGFMNDCLVGHTRIFSDSRISRKPIQFEEILPRRSMNRIVGTMSQCRPIFPFIARMCDVVLRGFHPVRDTSEHNIRLPLPDGTSGRCRAAPRRITTATDEALEEFNGFQQSESTKHNFVVSTAWLCNQHTRSYRTSTPHRRLVSRE